MTDPVYIEPSDEEIIVYRDSFRSRYKCPRQYYSIYRVPKFTFGYILPSSTKKDKGRPYSNKGIIFCSRENETLDIELLCSHREVGIVLLKQAESKAIELGIKVLHILSTEEYQKWYMRLGFKYCHSVCTRKGDPRFYTLRKYL